MGTITKTVSSSLIFGILFGFYLYVTNDLHKALTITPISALIFGILMFFVFRFRSKETKFNR